MFRKNKVLIHFTERIFLEFKSMLTELVLRDELTKTLIL